MALSVSLNDRSDSAEERMLMKAMGGERLPQALHYSGLCSVSSPAPALIGPQVSRLEVQRCPGNHLPPLRPNLIITETDSFH